MQVHCLLRSSIIPRIAEYTSYHSEQILASVQTIARIPWHGLIDVSIFMAFSFDVLFLLAGYNCTLRLPSSSVVLAVTKIITRCMSFRFIRGKCLV